MSENKIAKTGQVRFRLLRRYLRHPLLVLQLEMSSREYRRGIGSGYWTEPVLWWRDATLEDLSVMDISKLVIQRDGGEYPVCFRPYRRLTGWSLVLQIMQGSVGAPSWTDAKMQDLLFKEGKILGGVGLVTR